MYQSKDGNWWHNYQIYRKKKKIYDNLPNKYRTPCFAFLPWHELKKGDRVELEIWSNENHSRYLSKEEIITYIKALEKVRPFRIKIIEKNGGYWACVWYLNKFQTFSALTALRFAGEDNWNTHYPIVQFVVKYLDKAHILKLIGLGHLYVTAVGVTGNFSGHALCDFGHRSKIVTTKQLTEVIKKSPSCLNDYWTGAAVKYVKDLKENYEDICKEWGVD